MKNLQVGSITIRAEWWSRIRAVANSDEPVGHEKWATVDLSTVYYAAMAKDPIRYRSNEHNG
jgi:hypothetical protein